MNDDLKTKLIAQGIPSEEIAFIHEANTEVRKKELFARVRSGQVRILMGSTAKMGAGTNVQDRLIALHDLDCPWRPSDLAQRLGRIVRQGNQNPEVEIFRYVTENTFDAYLYHVGIVSHVEDETIYTIEGNSIGDSCMERTRTVGDYQIMGYGVPVY